MHSKEIELVINSFKNSSLYTSDEFKCVPLPGSGSSRRYFRFLNPNASSILGVYNSDKAENEAYLDFSEQFYKKHLAVPKILYVDPSKTIYFVEDIGNSTLFDYLKTLNGFESPDGLTINNETLSLYQNVIDHLLKFQHIGGADFDYSKAYPLKEFDRTSMKLDLYYFKYYFLKLTYTPFNEQLLEKDFDTLIDFLTQSPSDTFLYRDFQSRNIMLRNTSTKELGFIDFQGGRKGSAAYDLASLLYEAKANLSTSLRETILNYYIEKSKEYIPLDSSFSAYFYGFVYIRIFQAMGAYGLRGLYERKSVFLQSIPYAIKNLQYLRHSNKLPLNLPCLYEIIDNLSQSELAKFPLKTPDPTEIKLTINVYSFSFRKNLPQDANGNGGGFVFDCRGLPNPGRLKKYVNLNGHDIEVKEYLLKFPEVSNFVDECIKLSSFNIQNYIDRGFSNLYVAFGCTGGQHRSVYCAEEYSKRLKQLFHVNILITHIEHPKKLGKN